MAGIFQEGPGLVLSDGLIKDTLGNGIELGKADPSGNGRSHYGPSRVKPLACTMTVFDPFLFHWLLVSGASEGVI